MRYSVQLRYWIFVEGYGFLSFAKNMTKSIGKNITKNLSGKYNQRFLDHTKQFVTDTPKTVSKKAIQKTAEAVWLVIKLVIELQKSQTLHNRIILKQLQISMIKKYLKKYI